MESRREDGKEPSKESHREAYKISNREESFKESHREAYSISHREVYNDLFSNRSLSPDPLSK